MGAVLAWTFSGIIIYNFMILFFASTWYWMYNDFDDNLTFKKTLRNAYIYTIIAGIIALLVYGIVIGLRAIFHLLYTAEFII